MPNTALRLSTFMTSALTGSTTEPVNRNSTTRVVTTTIASAMGRCSSRLD